MQVNFSIFLSSPEDIFFSTLLEGEMKGEKKRERSIWEKLWLVASHMCPDRGSHVPVEQNCDPGIFPDRDSHPQTFAYGMELQLLSHTGQGKLYNSTSNKKNFSQLC